MQNIFWTLSLRMGSPCEAALLVLQRIQDKTHLGSICFKKKKKKAFMCLRPE